MQKKAFFTTLLITVVLISAISVYLTTLNLNYELHVLLIANFLMLSITVFSYTMIQNGIKSGNDNIIMRSKYLGTMVKFFVCIGGLLIYVFLNDRTLHKPTLFAFLGMYIIYSIIEALFLTKAMKK